MEDPSERLAQARFEAATGTAFEILDASGVVALVLQLIEVSPRVAPKGFEQYSALFRGPESPLLPQATYAMRHPVIGDLPLFIVPISLGADGVVYEACVSRRTGAAGGATSGA